MVGSARTPTLRLRLPSRTEGADSRAIQKRLGHANLSTTQKDTQVSIKQPIEFYDKNTSESIREVGLAFAFLNR